MTPRLSKEFKTVWVVHLSCSKNPSFFLQHAVIIVLSWCQKSVVKFHGFQKNKHIPASCLLAAIT